MVDRDDMTIEQKKAKKIYDVYLCGIYDLKMDIPLVAYPEEIIVSKMLRNGCNINNMKGDK